MKFLNLQLHEAASQRNEDRRAQYWCDISIFAPDMLVFLDESGFVSIRIQL